MRAATRSRRRSCRSGASRRARRRSAADTRGSAKGSIGRGIRRLATTTSSSSSITSIESTVEAVASRVRAPPSPMISISSVSRARGGRQEREPGGLVEARVGPLGAVDTRLGQAVGEQLPTRGGLDDRHRRRSTDAEVVELAPAAVAGDRRVQQQPVRSRHADQPGERRSRRSQRPRSAVVGAARAERRADRRARGWSARRPAPCSRGRGPGAGRSRRAPRRGSTPPCSRRRRGHSPQPLPLRLAPGAARRRERSRRCRA